MSLQSQQQLLQRQHRVQEACSAYNDSLPTLDRVRTFVVSHDPRVLFCVVGKVACTSWLRVLLQLTDSPAAQLVAALERSGVHQMFKLYLSVVSFKSALRLSRSRTKHYYKFMFVREPLERLVSAYRDKLFRDYAYVALRKHIISRYRRHPSTRYVFLLLSLTEHVYSPCCQKYTQCAIQKSLSIGNFTCSTDTGIMFNNLTLQGSNAVSSSTSYIKVLNDTT